MTELRSAAVGDSTSGIDASARPATSDSCGDVMLCFQGDDGLPPGRVPSGRWELRARQGEWKLWLQGASERWRGYPLLSFDTDGWRLWLLGELYGSVVKDSTAERFLSEIVTGGRKARDLNGHLLLFAWNETSRRWHVWTDRFGTVHAYYAADGRGAALGTFSPAVAAVASRRQLDWTGLTGFFAFGFFPQNRTFFHDVKILRPASHYVFDGTGRLLREERYWQWQHEPDQRRSYDDTVTEFGQVLGDVLADHARSGRIALPISGGLDSRTTVAVMARDDWRSTLSKRLWSYSYGYSDDSVETVIARQVASARELPFQALTVRPYLFDRLDLVLASVEGFQDVTQCRQATALDEIRRHADYVIAAHWGDVWLDDMGLVDKQFPSRKDELVVDHALGKIAKPGREWLLKSLCQSRLNGTEPRQILRDLVREELARVEDIADPDFRVKAFKTEQWSFRWTITGLRMFQPGTFPRLTFYDNRIADFFMTVPSAFVSRRRLQIDFLKRFAPDLARIPWQAYGTNLFRYRYFNSWLLPSRAFKKAMRVLTRRRVIERNWEVQFLSERGRQGVNHWLLRPGLRLHEFVSPRLVEALLEELYVGPPERTRGYAVSMLLSFAAWLEFYG